MAKAKNDVKNDVIIINSWDELMEQPRFGYVDLVFGKGENKRVVQFKLQGVSENVLSEIEEKYDALRPAQPVYNDPNLNKTIIIDDEVYETLTSPQLRKDYEKYKKKLADVTKSKLAEMVYEFLVPEMRPKGDSREEQIKQIRDGFLIGHFYEIIKVGYEISGMRKDEKVEEAKNS